MDDVIDRDNCVTIAQTQQLCDSNRPRRELSSKEKRNGEFSIVSCIRGFHIYRDIRTPVLDDTFECQTSRSLHNTVDTH